MPLRGGSTGSSIAVSISSAASAVVSAPTKKSAALMVRSLVAERARSRPPSARTMAGSSEAGSALARLPPMVPRLRICGCAISGSASVMSGRSRDDERFALKRAIARHGADAHHAVDALHARKLAQRVEVDQYRRLHQAEIHRRHQALAAGEEARVLAVLRLRGERLLDRMGRYVAERGGLHRGVWRPFCSPSQSRDPGSPSLLSCRQAQRAGKVLHTPDTPQGFEGKICD